MISVNSLFILSYYSNIWIQSIFVLKSEWWKTVMFSNIGSPRDIYEKTHFIFKTMIAYKIFFWKRNKLGEKSRFYFLRLGAKWDFSLVQGKTLSLFFDWNSQKQNKRQFLFFAARCYCVRVCRQWGMTAKQKLYHR